MVFYEYCLNSSLHGFHFIVDRRFHWIERIFWAICVLASWFACMKLNILTAENYSSNVISFTVDTHYSHWVTEFPSIIYCQTQNSFTDEQIERLFPGEPESKISTIEKFVFFQGNIQYTVDCDRYPGKCALGNFSKYLEELSSPCEDIFTSCYYNNKKFECCDHFLPVNTYIGKCYALNNLLTNPDDPYANLRFNFTYGVDAGLGNLSIELSEKYLFVIALSPEAIPSPLNTKYGLLNVEGSTYGLDVDTHYTVYLATKQIVCGDDLKDVELKQRGCRFGDENTLERYHYYSKPACDIEFMIKIQNKVCGCAAHVLLINGSDTDIECGIVGLKCISQYINKLKDLMRYSPCVSNCRGSVIHFVGSTTKSISTKQFRNPKSIIRNDFIVPAPTTRYQRRVVKTPLDSLVALGGAVALCVGASFLSIVEIVYYILIRPTGDECGSRRYLKIIEAFRQKERH